MKIFNSVPNEIKTYRGSLESFKTLLYQYLELLLDQPEIGDLKPEALTLTRKPSNSLIDWGRKLESSISYQTMYLYDDNSGFSVISI